MRYLFLLALLPFAVRAQSTYDATFKAFTAFGDPVSIRVLSLSDPMHHRDMVSSCKEATCAALPEGPYQYSVAIAETGRKVDGTAVVYRTNQVIVVDVGTATADLDDSEFPSISGTVTNATDPSKLWIRLAQLYGDMSVSARIRKDGTFVLDEVRPGNWMLLLFSDGKLVHSEPFVCKTTGNTQLKITLASNPK